MDEIITWSAIGKVALAGIGLYVIQPALLVARDAILWWAVDKWILNDRLHDAVEVFAHAEFELAELPHTSETRWENGIPTHKLDGKEVSNQALLDYLDNWHEATKRRESSRPLLRARRRRIEWILRHYKQPEQINPIDALLDDARKHHAAVKELRAAQNPTI